MRDSAAMQKLRALLLPLLALMATPALADEVVYESVEEIVYVEQVGSERFLTTTAPAAIPSGIASFGPFRVLDGTRAALVDATDEASPAQFAAMLRAYPGISLLEMIDCPGTEDDRANLAVGRMIRARGIATHVPAGGSVRSGGVELFLDGSRRIADPGSEFAVHAWEDEDGREATEYSADAPENQAYLVYYREMGFEPQQAAAFYAMTNSVPHAEARRLTAEEMGRWVRLD
jgi:hypothetical protein